jgi:hypothetical protein
MKAHIIENNLVVNSIEVNNLSDFPNLVDGSTGGIGWSYSNDTLVAPPVTPKTAIELATEARKKRNQLLAATDWTANSDVTMTTEMTAYRTLLRNLPAQADFPTTINWPTSP